MKDSFGSSDAALKVAASVLREAQGSGIYAFGDVECDLQSEKPVVAPWTEAQSL